MATDFLELWKKAKAAGIEAGTNAQVGKLGVRDAFTGQPMGIIDGPCGYAYVHYKGNTEFARWVKNVGHHVGCRSMKGYPHGFDIPIDEHGQAAIRKYHHARAIVEVLKAAGVDCYAHYRED